MIVNRNWVEGKISIHAPRAGSDNRELDCCCRVWISIHAPRAGSDAQGLAAQRRAEISIHAPRAGSDNVREAGYGRDVAISIHAPRAGSDYIENMKEDWKCYFNPRSPCGERLH